MSLRKTADLETAHATYTAGSFTWKILKVNAPAKSPWAQYSTWLVAAKSDMTFGSYEYGDTYTQDVLQFGTLVEATDEFKAYLEKHKSNTSLVQYQ